MGPWVPAKQDWIWGGIQGSAAPCPLYQVRIQPSVYDHNVPALEALVRVPQPHGEGPIMHKWSVQMVSVGRRGKGAQVSGGELMMWGWGEMCGNRSEHD